MDIQKDDFVERIIKIIEDKKNEKPITSLDCYTKKEIDEYYNYVLEKTLRCITDDYYDQDYIDSHIKDAKYIVDNIQYFETYDKPTIDSMVNVLMLLLNLKQDPGDNIPDNEWIENELLNIKFDSINAYTKTEFDNIVKSNILTKSDIGVKISSCKQAYDLNELLKQLQQQYRDHLDMLCEALTSKGVSTPKGSTIYNICVNIAKLNTFDTDIHDKYKLTKLIDLPEENSKVTSNEDANFYISSSSNVYYYDINGNIDNTVSKVASSSPVGIFYKTYDVDKKPYILLINSNSIQFIDSSKNVTTVSIPNVTSIQDVVFSDKTIPEFISGSSPSYHTDTQYILLKSNSSNNFNLFALSDIINNSVLDYKDTNRYFSEGCSSVEPLYTSNAKMYSSGAQVFIYEGNKLSTMHQTRTITYSGITSINCFDCTGKYILMGADNKIYRLNPLLGIEETIYTGSSSIRKIVSISKYNIHILEGNDKIISLDIKYNKKVETSISDVVLDMYVDSLNRVICVSKSSVYRLDTVTS
jgi:hypothetical protein